MTTKQIIITVVIIAAATAITRFLPFLLFPSGKKMPAFIEYLSRVLPAATFGLLVIYSIKDVNVLSGYHGIPELLAITLTVILQYFNRKLIFSVAGGTLFYIALMQFVFV